MRKAYPAYAKACTEIFVGRISETHPAKLSLWFNGIPVFSKCQ